MSAFCWGENVRLGHRHTTVTPEPLSFHFPSGAITALVGPNGAGKTTLIKSIVGEPVLLSGQLFLSSINKPVSELSPKELSEQVAMVAQEGPFPGDLLLIDFLKYAFLPTVGMFGRLPSREDPRLQKALALFGLEPLKFRPLSLVSTGERQKVFLARALLQAPKLLLLDEPTNHLDPGSIFSFWQAALEERKARPFEILLSTHDLDFVRHTCDWVCALKHGKIVYNGPVGEFWRSGGITQVFGEVFSVTHTGRD